MRKNKQTTFPKTPWKISGITFHFILNINIVVQSELSCEGTGPSQTS